jgi:hypothetical protein
MTYPGLKRVEIFFSSLFPRSTPPPPPDSIPVHRKYKIFFLCESAEVGNSSYMWAAQRTWRERGENVVYFIGCTDAALDNCLVSFSMTWISRDVLKRPKDDLLPKAQSFRDFFRHRPGSGKRNKETIYACAVSRIGKPWTRIVYACAVSRIGKPWTRIVYACAVNTLPTLKPGNGPSRSNKLNIQTEAQL